MNSYNNSIHRVTKHTPFEIFYSQNKELFFEVYQNTKEYFEKRQKDNISFDIKEKCLLINNIVKSKKKNSKGYFNITVNKVKKDKSFVKICVIIQKILGVGKYLIKIQKQYKCYKLEKNDLCIVDFKMLRKCENNLWEKLNNCNDLDLDVIDENSESLIESETISSSSNDIDSHDLHEDDDLHDITKKFRSLRI